MKWSKRKNEDNRKQQNKHESKQKANGTIQITSAKTFRNNTLFTIQKFPRLD